MMMKKLVTSVMVTALIASAAFTANLYAGPTNNPFKKGKKQPPAKGKKLGHNKPAKVKPTKFGGQAVALDITNCIAGAQWIIGDTGELPSGGGTLNLTTGATNLLDVINAGMVTASVTGGGSQSSSQVQVQGFAATFASPAGITNTISFAFAEAIAQAQCTSNGVAISASSQVQGLVINGASIVPTGETNQVITLSNGTVVLNGILASPSGGSPGISVAAIYVDIENCFRGVIGFAEANISCGTAPGTNGACGKVTGGGFIATTNGGHASFSVSGGIRGTAFWGNLNYIDHDTGAQVTSTGVTGFTVVDGTTRQIDYNVDIDGAPGTARVIVSDQGEPGRNDIFDITLSTGYHAGGDLGGSGSGGGNIQVHKCPRGWAK